MSTCIGKIRYATERSARRVVKRIRRSRKDGYGKLHAYLCPGCRQWHVGHTLTDRGERAGLS